MDFNNQKCLELMAESNKFRQEGKFLDDFDQTKSQELDQYIILLWDHVFWKTRYQYLKIIESFLSGSIDVHKFMRKFSQLRGLNSIGSERLEENLKNEIDFQPNLESCGFTEIIALIAEVIELFNPAATLDMNLKRPDLICYGLSEEFLKLDLKDNYLFANQNYFIFSLSGKRFTIL